MNDNNNQNIPIGLAPHVIQFASGKYRGQANTRVMNLEEATLFTLAEAKRKIRVFEKGTKILTFDDAKLRKSNEKTN